MLTGNNSHSHVVFNRKTFSTVGIFNGHSLAIIYVFSLDLKTSLLGASMNYKRDGHASCVQDG